jgi:hypothetical protein
MKKTLAILNILSYLLMVILNYVSNTGMINGNTMATVSAKYENLFTPAGYAFSIWGLIYLGLLGFVIFQAWAVFRKNKFSAGIEKIGWWFILSCIANIAWIFAWLYEEIALSVLIMVFLLFCLLKMIRNTRMELDDEPLPVIGFVWWPFSFYSGWITVALIANIAAFLTALNWNGFGISQVTWTIAVILVAGAINLIITWRRNMREFALVGVWALVAVAVANWSLNSPIVIAALGTAGILFLSSGIHGYKNRETSPWKKLKK